MSVLASSLVRRIRRVRYELVRREVEVVRIEPKGPSFLALTFHGPALAGLTTLSFDDHIKLFFTNALGEEIRRDYTPIAHDAARCEVTLEFALHDGGAASDWARHARVGTRAAIGGPKGSMVIPLDYDWHLLVGDCTALPAIERRLQELPWSARVDVVAEARTAADERPWTTHPQRQITWVRSPEDLVHAVQALHLPDTDGFVWCAGEAHVMGQLRTHLTARGWPKEAMRIAAYWKQGSSAFHERLEG